jgi:hypothetical protein
MYQYRFAASAMPTGYQFAQPLATTKYCLEVFRGRFAHGKLLQRTFRKSLFPTCLLK